MTVALDSGTMRAAPRIPPERLRAMLERLGPTFIKIGQYLALRPDILDPATCDELLKLVDRVPPDPLAAARRILTEDLGAPPEERFTWMAKQPIAAGSLAQVYEARAGDRRVAVKVQRAGVRQRVETDLRRLRRVVRALRPFGLVPDVVAGDLVEELRRWLMEELDFERELSNLARIHRLAKDSDVLVVPRPYRSLSGKRVITADFLQGVPFSVILRHVREGAPGRVADLGFDRRLLAEGLIEAMLEQIFRYRLFQADSHPGNIIALPGNRIGFVDFGLVETLEPVLERGLFRYLRAIYTNDVEEMLHGLEDVLVPGDWADPDGFRRDFLEENRRWQLERGLSRPDGSPVGRYMAAVLRAARRHDLRLPTGILAIYRSLLTAENVAHQLADDVNLGSVGRGFFEALQRETLFRLPDAETLQSDLLALVELVREGPRKLDRLLTALAGDRFRLKVEQVLSLADRRLRADQVRLLVAALIFVGVAALTGAAGELAALWRPLPALLWAALGGNLLWLVVLWRRLP
jgi:ubiquinone biosynthesis protein